MKAYVLMTSVALIAGTALGYFSGKDAAEDRFARDCADAGFAVLYDYSTREHRNFHCFELNFTDAPEPAAKSPPRDAFVL